MTKPLDVKAVYVNGGQSSDRKLGDWEKSDEY